MKVRLTHLDGKLPNLALMRISSWHKERGDEVFFTKDLTRTLFEPKYDVVYGSCIFLFTAPELDLFKANFPEAIIGGTGSGNWDTIEEVVGDVPDKYDYSIYPDFKPSIGFLQRGCRLKCSFCVVPKKEGEL